MDRRWVFLVVLLASFGLVVWFLLSADSEVESSDMSSGTAPREPRPERRADLRDVKTWERELIDGRPILIQEGSRTAEIRSLGPVADPTRARRDLQSSVRRLRDALRSAPPEQTVEDVMRRTEIHADLEERSACLKKLQKGEYFTIAVGDRLPVVPKEVRLVTYSGGYTVNGKAVELHFLIAPGDSPAFDQARSAFVSCLDAYLEELSGNFNNQPHADRVRRIRAHDEAIKFLDSLRGNSDSSLSEARRAQLVTAAKKNLLDPRLLVDRRSYTLRRSAK